LASKSLATNFTLVRALVRVRSLVNQQIVRLRKVTTAESTDELTSAMHHDLLVANTMHAADLLYNGF